MKRKTACFIALLLLTAPSAIYGCEPSIPSTSTFPAPTATASASITSTPMPTLNAIRQSTLAAPYPTAETIKPGAVAFVAKDWENYGPSSLWIANADGSGERQLVARIEKSNWPIRGYVSLKWSPDGKWISFLSNDDLWLASPDGSVVRRVLSLPDKDKGLLYTYAWSPDGSRIAYVQAAPREEFERHAIVAILDVVSGHTTNSFTHDFPYTVSLDWLPDGKHLLLNGPESFAVIDPATGETEREITLESDVDCERPAYFDRLDLAPSGHWFTLWRHGNGIGGHSFFCIVGMDSALVYYSPSASAFSFDGSSGAAWESAGETVYFTAADIQPWAHGAYDPHGRLMRFNARTGELQFLMPLETKEHGFFWPVSVSPDGQKLELHAATQDKTLTFVIVKNLHSFSSLQYTLDEQPSIGDLLGTAWASDSQSLILFAGSYQAPNTLGVVHYGSFYRLDIQTRETTLISGQYWVDEWLVSPH